MIVDHIRDVATDGPRTSWLSKEDWCVWFQIPYYILWGTRPRQWGNTEIRNVEL